MLIEETMDGPKPDKLVCVAVYKVGALEVKRRLEGQVRITRKMVICPACRKDLRIRGPQDAPTDPELPPMPDMETPLGVLFPEDDP